MRSKPIHIIFLVLIIIPFLKGQNNTFKDLEKRVEQLEGKVFDLERRSIDTLIESRWHKLKKNMKKKDVQSTFGSPDRVGYFAYGGELWGFSNAILRFDKNGSLEYWTKPLRN